MSISLRHKEWEEVSADCWLYRFEHRSYRGPGCSRNRSVDSHLLFSYVRLCRGGEGPQSKLYLILDPGILIVTGLLPRRPGSFPEQLVWDFWGQSSTVAGYGPSVSSFVCQYYSASDSWLYLIGRISTVCNLSWQHGTWNANTSGVMETCIVWWSPQISNRRNFEGIILVVVGTIPVVVWRDRIKLWRTSVRIAGLCHVYGSRRVKKVCNVRH